VAAYVAEHFRTTVEPMGYKAFLVAVDREACCLYKEALDEHLPPEYSTVVISEAWKKDSERMQRHYLSEEEEKTARLEFRKPDTTPKILIVTEKLLTGFDAPILYAMYLDKPMRDHVLLQAIARVNRPYEDAEQRRKTCGFVLDFVGIFDHLEKALAFDSQDVAGVIQGVDVLQKRFADLMARGRSEYLPILAGKDGDKAVEAVLLHFREQEPRTAFYEFFRELQDVYEILSPDPFLRPYLEDFTQLLRMFHVLRAAYDRDKPIDREFLRKTARLVQEHTETGTIDDPTQFHALTADALTALTETDQPDTVKIFNLLKALANLVQEHATVDPYLISIGDRAEEVAKAFGLRQMTTQQALAALTELVGAVKEAESSRTDTGLSADAFAVYYVLKTEGVRDPLAVARAVDEAFTKFPHWKRSERQEQALRRSLYKALLAAGIENEVELAGKLMNVLERTAP
jgi:type I restriction enzyme R subunit